jgi:lysophospholipase L1-like esterase
MKRILAFAVIPALLLSSCAPGDAAEPPDVPPGQVITFAPLPTAEPVSTPEPKVTADIPASSEVVRAGFTLNDIIFLGDSTTYGLKAYAVLSGGKETTQVWTPASGTLTLDHQSYATIVYPEDGSEITIRAAAETAKPTAMIITLGVNGVSFMGEDSFKSEYSDLIDGILNVSPDTRIILQSIFPVAENYEHLKSINNDKILAANVWVKEIADDKELTYIDTHPKLTGEDGWLSAELQNGDGLHLNERGFAIAIDNISSVLGLE